MLIEVVHPGLLTTLQDAGRPGLAHLGIGHAGAFDTAALALANRLCGNPRDACGLEVTLRGPGLRFAAAARVAITGAPLTVAIDGVAAPMWTPIAVPAGALLTLGAMRSGCRSWLAIGGGVAVPPVLGSRSCDVNARLGPLDGRALAPGDRLPIGAAPAPDRPTRDRVSRWSLDPRPWYRVDPALPLRLLPGAHLDRLTAAAREQLFGQPFRVHADSNRVGLRLTGPPLAWRQPVEMVSEGCVPGTLQLPPTGQPIAFGPECPVSGGYPRIGQIAAVDLPRLAQLRPGDALRFVSCTLSAAAQALAHRERALLQLEAHIAMRRHP